MRRLGVALICGALAHAAAPNAIAKPEPPPKSAEDAHARDLYKQGDTAYAEGRYEDALGAFREAFELSKRPLLLFNIGNTLERLGRWQEAADTFEQYAPFAKAEERKLLEKRIANLKKRASEPKDRQDDESSQPEPAPKKPAPPEDVGKPQRTAGWILVGAGGAVLATGVVLGVMALRARSEANEGCKEEGGQRLCSSSAKDAVDRDKRLSVFADVAFGVGAVAAGAGAYLLLTAPHDTERAVGARARPGGGEIQFVGRF